MGRELREPPSDEGVLQEVANRLVRGRIVVAAGCAIVGFAAALGLLAALRATPFLVLAIGLALATLAVAIAAHHLPAVGARVRAAAIALLAAGDAVAFTAAACATGGGAAVVVALAPLIGGSILLHALALVRIGPLLAPRPSGGTLVIAAHLAEVVSGKAREAAGIVRARAEALRLAVEEAGVSGLLGHDLEVLVRQAEECQRVLRELDQALAVRVAAAARLPARAVPEPEPCPSESTPLRS